MCCVQPRESKQADFELSPQSFQDKRLCDKALDVTCRDTSFPIKDPNRMKDGKNREAAFINNKDARKLQSVQPRDGELRGSTVDLSPYLAHTHTTQTL